MNKKIMLTGMFIIAYGLVNAHNHDGTSLNPPIPRLTDTQILQNRGRVFRFSFNTGSFPPPSYQFFPRPNGRVNRQTNTVQRQSGYSAGSLRTTAANRRAQSVLAPETREIFLQRFDQGVRAGSMHARNLNRGRFSLQSPPHIMEVVEEEDNVVVLQNPNIENLLEALFSEE